MVDTILASLVTHYLYYHSIASYYKGMNQTGKNLVLHKRYQPQYNLIRKDKPRALLSRHTK